MISVHHPRWKTALFEIAYSPARHGLHSSTSERLLYSLILNDGQKETRFPLQELFLRGYPPTESDLAPQEFKKIAKAKPLLEASSDGSVLLFSVDRGKNWKFISLHFLEEPFYCAHRSFPGNSDQKPNWALIPSLKDFVKEVLLQKNPPLPSNPAHLSIHDTPRDRTLFERELVFALSYVCEEANHDQELREALFQTAVGQGSPYLLSQESNALVACAQKLLRKDPTLFKGIDQTLRSGEVILFAQRARGAEILKDWAIPSHQETLAFALNQWMENFKERLRKLKEIQAEESKVLRVQSQRFPFSADWMLCREGEIEMEALANITSKLKKASPFVEKVLAKAASFDEQACSKESHGKIFNIYGILGLQAGGSPQSLKILEKIAQQECPEKISLQSFSDWTQSNRTDFVPFPACYAQAILEAKRLQRF